MAEFIAEREEASIRLLTFEFSDGVLEALVACVDYVLDHADDQLLEQLTGAYRDELEAIRDNLSAFLGDDEPETQAETPANGAIAEPA
jgi:hypothetical protein